MATAAWFRGSLLSRHFVEHVLPRSFVDRRGESSAEATHRRLRRWWIATHARLGPASGVHAIADIGAVPFFACFGYRMRRVRVVGATDTGAGARDTGGALLAFLDYQSGRGAPGLALPLVVTPWQVSFDQAWRLAVRAAIESGQRWVICFSGRRLRLIDGDRPYARRFLELDLAESIGNPSRYRLLWTILRPAAFVTSPTASDVRAAAGARRSTPIVTPPMPSPPTGPSARTSSSPGSALLSEIVAACEAHGVGIREALQGGVRDALELLCADLARAVRAGRRGEEVIAELRKGYELGDRPAERHRRQTASIGAGRRHTRRMRATVGSGLHPIAVISPEEVVSQGLTLLYRLLFLLFAEARALVPIWHPIYRDSYAIGALQREAERPSPRGLWDALQAISRLAHAGCITSEFSMTAFNGQLFSPETSPLIDRARIDSAVVARVLQSLTTTAGATGRGRERITYADLGVEQLGAVYERILDYAPQLEDAAARLLTGTSAGLREETPERSANAANADERDAGTWRASAADPGAADPGAAGPGAAGPDAAARVDAARVDTVRVDTVRVDAVRTRVARARAGAARISVRRKESGTFYTPRGLADYLVRETLGPLTREASPDRILALKVLDPAMGSGAFLVSACRFLAQAYEQAAAREGRPVPATERARAEIRRTIARQCLFGVDRNPMAVQLARLSLWLTTLTRDAPLTFLDHHLRVGDSLIGASLDDLARRLPARPLAGAHSFARGRRGGGDTDIGGLGVIGVIGGLDGSGDIDGRGDSGANRGRGGHTRDHALAGSVRFDGRRPGRHRGAREITLPLFSSDDTSRLMRAILPARAQLIAADDSPRTVHEKERLLASLAREGALARWLRLADVWCASWFWTTTVPAPPQTAWAALADHVLHGSDRQPTLPRGLAEAWAETATAVAARHRFFHWTLEFPEVFFDTSGQPRADGGFDAIVGNPPWDMVRDDGRRPSASPRAATEPATETGPDGMRADTQGRGWSGAGAAHHGDAAAFVRFMRESGIYDATGEAHANSYQLFVDRSLSLLRHGGRLGLVVPWGLAADHGSARLRRRLLERGDLESMVAFDNRDGLFPIHRSVRFVAFVCQSGRPTTAVRCRFGVRDPAVIDREAQPAATLSIAPGLLRRLSGEGMAFPDVRSAAGLALVERLHATWPPLTSADGWGVAFSRELNVTDDRGLFTTRDASEAASGSGSGPHSGQQAELMPVIEGKHLHPFAVHAEASRFVVRPEHADALIARRPGIARPRIAYRDIASPTNRTTLIAAIVPPLVVTTHTLFCLRSPLDLDAQHCLCALMNSFVANYLVRLRVSTHVTVALLDHLPMPRPLRDSAAFQALSRLAAEATTHAAAPEAARAPGPRGIRAAADRASTDGNRGSAPHAEPELQAWAAHAYGLTRAELVHVLSTFPLIDEEEKNATLRAYEAYEALGTDATRQTDEHG